MAGNSEEKAAGAPFFYEDDQLNSNGNGVLLFLDKAGRNLVLMTGGTTCTLVHLQGSIADFSDKYRSIGKCFWLGKNG